MSGSVGVRDLPNTEGKANRTLQYQIDNSSSTATDGFGFVHLPLSDMEPPVVESGAVTADITSIVESNKFKLLGVKCNMLIRAGKLKDEQENVPVRIIWGWHYPEPKDGWGLTANRVDETLPKPRDLYTVSERPAQANKGINDVLYPWPKNRRDSTQNTVGNYKILGNKVVIVNSGPTAGKEDTGTRESWATIKFGRKIIEWHQHESNDILDHAPGVLSTGTTKFMPRACGEPFIMAYVHDDRSAPATNFEYAAKIKFETRVYWQNLK